MIGRLGAGLRRRPRAAWIGASGAGLPRRHVLLLARPTALQLHTLAAAPSCVAPDARPERAEPPRFAPELAEREVALACGNRVLALHDGVECFPALHAAIEAARHEILFEMYWFESDSAGWSVAHRLIDAAERGVTVRVVYDAFGSMDADRAMFERMRRAGCEVLEFNPISPFRERWQFDRISRRDHRKMIVLDRKVVFTGGMNIGDFWLPRHLGGEGWRDMMVRIEGPVAVAFAQIFERLAGPLRDGHDDRGPLEALDPPASDANSLVCADPVRALSRVSVLLRRNWSLADFRDQVAVSVDKGKDAMSRTLFKRLSKLPESTLLLFPFDLHSGVAAANQTANRATAASDAWWSAQGRLKLNWKRPEQDQSADDAAPLRQWRPKSVFGPSEPSTDAPEAGEEETPRTRSLKLPKRRLQFEQVMSQWQTLGSNIQIITNDAFSERNTIRRGYLRAINAARERITIANSYFVPCNSIRRALYRAVERGVEVRVIVPGAKTDLHSVRFATRAMYDHMLKKGIQLYEFRPSVLHSKLCVIDWQVSTLGTYNLDYRSWYHNLEIVAIIHNEAFARQIEERIDRDISENCDHFESVSWAARPWFHRLSERFFYFFRHHM